LYSTSPRFGFRQWIPPIRRTRALAEFVARHADDRVEAAMNGVVAEVGPGVDEFTREAARKTLRRVEW
jgi:hypothetical protein